MSLIRSILSRHDGPGGVDDTRRRALAVGNLAESLSVERGGKTFVITVSATTQNGEKSALIANTMTDVFLQTFGQIQSDTAGRATDELTARLDELRKGVEAAERKVEDFRADARPCRRAGSPDQRRRDAEAQRAAVDRARPHPGAQCQGGFGAFGRRQLGSHRHLAGGDQLQHDERTALAICVAQAGGRPRSPSGSARVTPNSRRSRPSSPAHASSIAAELRRIGSSLQVDLKRAVQLEQDLASRLAQLKVRRATSTAIWSRCANWSARPPPSVPSTNSILLRAKRDRRAEGHQHRQHERDLEGLRAARGRTGRRGSMIALAGTDARLCVRRRPRRHARRL